MTYPSLISINFPGLNPYQGIMGNPYSTPQYPAQQQAVCNPCPTQSACTPVQAGPYSSIPSSSVYSSTQSAPYPAPPVCPAPNVVSAAAPMPAAAPVTTPTPTAVSATSPMPASVMPGE